jgi:DhnA family fructose-bisphosphate aldolase class Ia
MKKLLFSCLPIVTLIMVACEKTACDCYHDGVSLEIKLKQAPEHEKNEILQELNELIKDCHELGIRDEDFDACE